MKKILTLTIAFVAMFSHAASINWQINTGAATMKDSTGAKLGGTAYLLLSSDVASLDSAKSEDVSTFLSALSTKAIGQTAIADGKASPNTSGSFSSSSLVAGNGYSFQFVIFDSANNEYYLSSIRDQNAYDAASSDAALQVPTSILFDANGVFATRGTTASTADFLSAVKAGGGDDPGPGGDDPVTPPIPEPATGALALAGLALLFRRKKA